MDVPILRILLVEDNPGDARLLLEGIKEEGGAAFDVTWTESLRAATSAIRQKAFDAVLLDLHLPDSVGLETFQAVRAANPNLPCVLLTGTEDEGIGLRAVQDGAQDYLVKGQAAQAAVVRSLRFAVERNRSLQWHMTKGKHSPGGRVITFWGAKGGVGCTTVALNCAAVLAQEKLLIAAELRPDHGSFAAHFRKPIHANLSDLYRMAPAEIAEAQMEQRLVNTQLGFYLLAGPQTVAECGELTPAHADRLLALTSRIAELTVVDLPAGSGPVHETIIHRSNAVVLLAERDDASVLAAKVALERLRLWGVSSDVVNVVLVNRSALLDSQPKERIEEQIGAKVTAVVPPAPDMCSAALRASTPLAVFRPRSAPAAILQQIAQRAAEVSAGPVSYTPADAA
jgi:Flp pilus assembly CpaE family ATPase